MAKIEKSKAELYREERKDRIAKANKKNAKSIEAGKAAANVGKKVLSVVICLAIVFGILCIVNSATGATNRIATAVTVGDEKVNASEFNYYYNNMYQQTVYYAQYYSQYGMNMGYDSSLSPDDPKNTTKDADGNNITWSEYFRQQAIDRVQFVNAYYNEAKKANFTLDDDAKAEIDETVENYANSAKENNFTLNAYLKQSFGAGINEKKFRSLLEKEQIASGYYNQIKEEKKSEIKLDDIVADYKENHKDYDYTDIHYYTFTANTLTAKSGESDDALKTRQTAENEKMYKEAEAVAAKATDLATLETALTEYLAKDEDKKEEDKTEETAEAAEKSEETKENTTELKNTTYSTAESSIGKKGADWLYESGRKAGDIKLITDDSKAYIIVVDKAAYTGHSVDVRHCLVKFNAADEENVTEAEKANAKKIADELLAEFNKGDKSEASFAKMATESSEDTGSVENGGLYEKIRITDSYVAEFLKWSFDPARKAGDVGIIETEYGYHIMYFSKDNKDDLDQYETIRATMGDSAFESYDEALLSDDGDYKVEASEHWTNKIADQFCKRIKKNLAYNSK